MPENVLILAPVLLLILAAEFVNGWTDSPNAIATAVSTRALAPAHAVMLAAVFNILGTLSGTAVANTIATGVLRTDAVNIVTVGAAMVGIVFWSTVAYKAGLPTSESHAIVAGLAGAGLATGGPDVLLWAGWQKVLIGLVFSSFLGFGAAFVISRLVYLLFAGASPATVRAVFLRGQIFSAAFMAFSHGSNDGQKFMGAFTLALVLGGLLSEFTVPIWVILLCGAVMGVGTAFGGWRIIHTVGLKVTKLEPFQGFSAETGAAMVIEVASRLGIPLSTTHTITTSIMGVGASRRFSAVRWGVAGEIVSAWILTFPICAGISWGVAWLANMVIRL